MKKPPDDIDEFGIAGTGREAPRGGFRNVDRIIDVNLDMSPGSVARAINDGTWRAAEVAQPTKHFRTTLGIGPVVFSPHTIATVTANPQVYFRGERFLPTRSAPGLFITNIFVGAQRQTAIVTPIAVDQIVFEAGKRFDTCAPGLTISFVVENRGNKERVFHATLEGKALKP